MPATEKTWYDLKLLHVVFGLTAIVLLLTTIAMLSADHNRPWKKYQKGFRELETWSASARVAEENSDTYATKTADLEAALADARRAIARPVRTERQKDEAARNAHDATHRDRVPVPQAERQTEAEQSRRPCNPVLRATATGRCRR